MSKNGVKLLFCKKCGKELDDRAIVCPGCGISVKEKSKFYKKWWFWLIVGFFVFVIALGSSGSEDSGGTQTEPVQQEVKQPEKPAVPQEFADVCPVTVSASIYDNIIGFPELECSVKNNTAKEIAAVQFYFVPKDVYGDELDGIFAQNKLYTDAPIAPNGTDKRAWQLLEQEIKSGDIYIYSVYFTDGSEWGDRNATVSKIKKHGQKINVSY